MNPTRTMRHDPHTGVQIRVGVMGSASAADSPTIANLSRSIGRAVAESGCCLLTGPARGSRTKPSSARKKPGVTSWASPRPPRSGTLGEFAIAYEEGKLVGVLTGTGGITEALAAVTAAFRKDTGAQVIYDSEPTRLVDLVLDRYLSADYHCPCKPDPRSLR